ncbi:uncharacterized protein BKCO1_1400033 [Diplodia corticola]|uniref:DUF7514 domain-containing protein n=1 Tax=Diplodia corticola TaxID=236234 RepID=A0A1J9S7Q5_9PEZI|nr:uncharacterized protein BKCO1_1400033 [Diplodia corticola]OJD35948.1 hypothetical protein BKCO1_1400033 [Diplodia corticola]
MAYDYRSSDPPLPPHGAYLESSDHPSSTSSYSAPPPRRTSRSSSADGSQSSQQGQPVYEAVNSAFDKSNAASQLDRDLVAQITEEVRKQVLDTLKSSGQLSSSQSKPREKKVVLPESSTTSVAGSCPPRVYTPPSPTRHDSIHSTNSSNSPEPPAQDPYFKSDAREREGPTPQFGGTRATSSITSDHGSQYGATQHSNTSATAQYPPRPPVQRHFTDVEETAIEKTWRPLFDADGQPTPRLSQFLRGLALHLMQDYEPKGTLVVTPAKMRKFYEETRVQDEIYPWSTIFGTLSNSAISKMYRDLRCLHHLVQERVDEVPNIPSLTPLGFDTWMTLMIQGHPEIEFARLAKAVMHMPISNSDDIKERFPKELPRRLFPKFENLPARQRCAAAICSSGKITIRAPTFPPPPPTQPPMQTSSASYPSYPADTRETAVASSDSDNEPVTIPIERERKPYIAREGTGKLYEHFPNNPMNSSAPVVGLTSESAPPDAGASSRVPRTYSNASSSASGTTGLYRTSSHSEYPPSTTQTRQYRTGSHMNGSRRRSPSFSTPRNDGYGTRSEPGNVGDIPTSYYTSNIYSDPGEDDNGAPRSASRAQFDMNSHRNNYVPNSQARHNSLYDEGDYYRRGSGASAAAYGTGAYSGYPPPPPRYT